jgi:DNA-directed RNA polymerase subunit D
VEIEIRKLEGVEMKFVLSDATPAFANALRRAAIREVPVMAIDEVEFKRNDSAMYDEVLAHRLAMIPLKTPLSGYVLPGECKCGGEGCPGCTVELRVKAEGPTTVMSGDLKSSDEEVTPISNSIPIVKLVEGQDLEFTATARLGLGKDHAKWIPGVVAYKYMPVINIAPRKCSGCEKCVEVCPKDVLGLREGRPYVKDPEACTECNACIDVCSEDAITISADQKKFVFTVESSGTVPPEQIILRAIDSLKDKFEEFSRLVKKL